MNFRISYGWVRGLTDLDIVDVLDGFICRGHAAAEEVDLLIHHAMMFGIPLKARKTATDQRSEFTPNQH